MDLWTPGAHKPLLSDRAVRKVISFTAGTNCRSSRNENRKEKATDLSERVLLVYCAYKRVVNNCGGGLFCPLLCVPRIDIVLCLCNEVNFISLLFTFLCEFNFE